MLPSPGSSFARLRALHHSCALHRLLLYGTTTASTSLFAAEDYLVATCGLTPAKARRASKSLLHVKSPDNPDAVRAFLTGIGLSQSDMTTAIARLPLLLCSRVDQTLAPCVAKLSGDVGLSLPEICRLVTIIPNIFTSPSKLPRLAFFLSFFGSFDQLHTALRRSHYLLSSDLELLVKPNLAFLQQCGLSSKDIAMTSQAVSWNLGRVKETVARVEELGVPRNSGMFRFALQTICTLSSSTISARMDFLKTALECSEAELAIALCKLPQILACSEKKLGGAVDFLKREIGLEARYIVHRPALLIYSLDRRVVPRHYVMKVLKAKGLLKKDISFYWSVSMSEKRFVEKFLVSYKDSVPGLMDAYAAACKGQVIPKVELSKLGMDFGRPVQSLDVIT